MASGLRRVGNGNEGPNVRNIQVTFIEMYAMGMASIGTFNFIIYLFFDIYQHNINAVFT
jgi:hypothetical protein